MKHPERYGPFPLASLLGSSLAAIAGLVFVVLIGGVDLSRFYGDADPFPVTVLVCFFGVGALYLLYRNFSFRVFDSGALARGVPTAMVLAIPFMVAVTIADVIWRFPVDINVPLPAAVFFYPVIGYVAQLALHILPLAVVLSLLGLFWPAKARVCLVWTGIILVSTLEAGLQAMFSHHGGGSAGLTTFVAVSLFLFGVTELYLFRHYDFVTMYAFRIVYYGYWHLAWGSLRLHWLF